MPVLPAAGAVVHEMHGSVFTSFAAPASGSRELCAWRLEVPAGSRGVPHRVSKEEILLVLSGVLRVTLSAPPEPGAATAADAAPAEGAGPGTEAAPGDAILVPAGAVLQVDNPGAGPAAAWVTTSVGLEAVLADGSAVSPPWVR
jgi:quercetin dioxygenase-like cupin family protein